MNGRLVAVNVGRPQTLRYRGRDVPSAIAKTAVGGRVGVGVEGLVGDAQADRRAHGGPDKAVYAYGTADYAWWAGELGASLAPGTFGENLTVAGLEVSHAVVGERWQVGTAVLEVCQPRTPCFKLGVHMDDVRFPARFAAAGLPGAYLRVLLPGDVGVGDEVVVVSRPDHGVTAADVAAAMHDPHRDGKQLRALLDVPALPSRWRAWAEERLASSTEPLA